MSDISLNESDEVTIADSSGEHKLKVNNDGSINVNAGVAPTPPTGTTVVQNTFGSVSSTVGVDTLFVIPNGKTLTLQQMSGGAEPHSSGTIVELFEDPNGDLSVLTRIETVFVNGSSDQVDIGQDFIGDGTRRIVMRRRVYAAAAREVWGRWKGFTL